ncbi:AAA family ATPase [Sphingobacterium bovistauri]|uniref:AAA family ATPase n=1 Tax=Sphingobacterium bovistauri TaxID=2781959 RepID=A0ABS7Z7P4_9SPHI|nr:AAA family ATPase [Sphingobacterium bovistauri]MCA5006210.1 AAA family ATPase [Sphingobacterium bovistauri]
MIYISKIRNLKPKKERKAYPYNIEALRHLTELEFTNPITFIVGENGMGKSTLVEAIAIKAGFNPEGGSRNFNFETMNSHSALFEDVHITRTPWRNKDGYFLRAESFYNVASEVNRLYEGEPYRLERAYGHSLHECSHGESFMALLHNRFSGKGLYIFDEPESALSLSRQMNMMVRIKELLNQDSQFIIATHSPILLAYPDAEILHLDEKGIKNVEYEDTDQYRLTKFFLNNHERMLKELDLL